MRIRNSSELGGLIRETRRQLGLDQGELAQKVGVSRQWIIEIEKGKPRAAVGLILRTLNALGICLDAPDSLSMSTCVCSSLAAWNFQRRTPV